MKKLFIFNWLPTLLFAFATIGFASCSSDDDDKVTEFAYAFLEQELNITETSLHGKWIDAEERDDVMCFENNGTGYFIYEDYNDILDVENGDRSYFTYILKDNKLIIYKDSNGMPIGEYEIVSITTRSLTFKKVVDTGLETILVTKKYLRF